MVEVKKLKKKIRKKKNFLLYMIICFIFSSIISFVICTLASPKIEIEEKNITLEFGENYKEPKYMAMLNNKDVTNLVKKKGKVNDKILGTYKVEYDIKYSIFEDKQIVTVEVIDKEAPNITLTGGEEVTVCPNKEYEELGFTATDNYDGDITSKVKIKKEENIIDYSVKDSSNNKKEVTRRITKDDVEKPIITLKGNTEISLAVNTAYQEPGYTASDNCDGDITSKVETSGSINTSTVGTYTLTYKVKDNNDNETTITRTIKIYNPSLIRPSSGGSGRGIIYLTFDDGPNEGTTNIILNILKEEGVSATFFVTCNGPDYLIKRMHDEGHTVALHTATHNYNYVYANEINYFNDLARVSDRVERITGEKSMIIRFPGGSSNTVSKKLNRGIMSRLTQEVKRRGYHYFDWNVDSNDAAGASTNGVYNNVINNISLNRENVVLMHDVKATTRDAIRNIIRYGKQNGYTFRKIDYNTVMVTHGVNN